MFLFQVSVYCSVFYGYFASYKSCQCITEIFPDFQTQNIYLGRKSVRVLFSNMKIIHFLDALCLLMGQQ